MKYVASNDNFKKARAKVQHQFNIATETPVIFRRTGDEITAYFPALPAKRGHVVCYAHVGQHGEASELFMQNSKPATEAEFAPLLAELKSIYEEDPDEPVKLFVRKRDSDLCRWMRYENKQTA